MNNQIIPQPASTRKQIALVPIESLGTNQIPSLIDVAGHTVHAPLIEDDTLTVDTGEQILEFNPAEVRVLALILTSLANAPEVA